MPTTGYTRGELLELGNALPSRGEVCDRCGAHIPEFAEWTPRDRARVMDLIRQGRKIMAVRELRAATGCSLRVAQLWIEHDGRPQAKGPPGPPCPYCEAPLPPPQPDWSTHLEEKQPKHTKT
jgi:hypothetical protein